MIYDLHWRHPGVLLSVCNVLVGGVVLYMEHKLSPSLGGALHSGIIGSLMSVMGLLFAVWVPLNMIACPYKWLPECNAPPRLGDNLCSI